MSNLFAKVGGVIASIGLAIGGFFGYVPEPEIAYVPEAVYVPQEEVYAPEEETLGADAVLPVAGVTYYLAGTGISSSATSFTLTSFTVTQNGKKIQDSEMSETFYFTLEPGSRSRQEIVACTTVVQNADNTATISGCTRGMAPVTPYTASTSLQFAHAGGSIAILSNPPQLYNQVAIKDNDETITGYWDFPSPVAGTNPTTKDYVLSVVTGGSVTTDSVIVSGIAGETFATGTVVYLATADQRWYKADADLESTFSDKQLGIAQGVGSSGVAVPSGILTYGIDRTQVSLSAGGIVWLSATAGATTTSTTTQVLGVAIDTDEMFFNPQLVQSSVTKQVTFTSTTTFSGYINGVGSSTIRVYTASTTYTKPSNLRHIVIEGVGGGGGGGYNSSGDYSNSGGGGGSGAYFKKIISASQLSATTAIVIGAGGTGGTSGAKTGVTGGSTIFTGFATSTGGTGGTDDTGYYGFSPGGSGGTATGGDLNITGNPGQGGINVNGDNGHDYSAPGNGGPSVLGTYGAGGGGGYNGNGSTGANGVIIITEYL